MWGARKHPHRPALYTMQTGRLILRPAIREDFTQWRDVRARNQSYLKLYEPAWPRDCLSESFFHRRVERLQSDWANDRTYAFLVLKDDHLIGGININNVSRGAAQYATLGYWIDEAEQGNGYMREATRAVIDFAFSVLHLNRMNAATLPHNHRSRRMLTALGFTEEGFARNYIQIDGARQDHVLYGLNDFEFSGAAKIAR